MKGNSNSVNKELQEIKAITAADIVTISDLFRLSFRLIKLRVTELLLLYFSTSLVSSASFLFHMQRQVFGAPNRFNLLAYIIPMLVSSFLYPLQLSAIIYVYETGCFNLINLLVKTINVFLKYLWTHIIFMVFACGGSLIIVFFVTLALIPIRVPYAFMFLLTILLIFPLAIWFLARAFFFPYVVVCHNRYGLSALERSFKITKGYVWRMIGYWIPIALLSSLTLVPVIAIIRGDFIMAALISVPTHMIAILTINAYGFVLYKNFIHRIS